MKRIVVTGASGFIGRPLVLALAASGFRVRAVVRRPFEFPSNVELAVVPDFRQGVAWLPLMREVDVVIHLAGIAHRLHVTPEEYESVNAAGTAALVASAAMARVRHFIFMSSIGAQSGSSADHVLTEDDIPKPTSAYGRSKLSAEVAVRAAGVPFTIFRPVLTYGPGVKGNMGALTKVAESRWPLPFGGFTNRRSLLAIDNLIEALRFAVVEPSVLGQSFILADPDPMSVAEIIATLRTSAGHPPNLITVPPSWLEFGLGVIRRKELWERIGCNLVVDPKKIISVGWRPCIDTRAALRAMVVPFDASSSWLLV